MIKIYDYIIMNTIELINLSIGLVSIVCTSIHVLAHIRKMKRNRINNDLVHGRIN